MKKQKIELSLSKNLDNKLNAVKTLKELSGFGLKESKFLIDDLDSNITLDHKDKIYINVQLKPNINKKYFIDKFRESNIILKFNDREIKMKRLLYSDQTTLIETMLMENWEDYVSETDKKEVSYIVAKENAVQKIIEKYKDYINVDFFIKMNSDIDRINKLENKDIGGKFMKFNEEFGEFNAEYLKFLGLTYKEYDRDDLLGEMADSLQVLLSIFNQVGQETGISIQDILEKIFEKNIKWETKIKDYKQNI